MVALVDTRAFVLKSIPYGESDRIVTLFTELRGKVGAMARGARKSRKRFGGALEPYAMLRVQLSVRPTSELAGLDRADVIEPNPGVSTDLVRMGEGATALELCRELLAPEQPEPQLFGALAALLHWLGEKGASTERLIGFELYALALAGMAPRLGECGVCGKAVPAGKAALFDPSRGGVVCRADGGGPLTLSGRAREGLTRLQAGQAVSLAAKDAHAAADAIRSLTEWQLGRKLKGGSFLRQVKA